MRQLCAVVFFAAAMFASAPMMGQSLNIRVDGDRLRINVGRVRLLTGDPLQKLRDGASVSYTFQLSALSDRSDNVLTRAVFRFVISYDIFEEKFQVSRLQPSARVLSHLTIAAAEAALIDALELPVQAIEPDRPFRIRWEYQAGDMSETGDSGVTLGGLVEIFSRRGSKSPVSGLVESGPFRLRDLPRATPTRGVTNP